MILITGGTGFVGRALIRHLVAMGRPVRTLLRPTVKSPDLPKGVSMEVAVSSLKDERGLRAAMAGVDVIYHLASSERLGIRADLTGIDIEGTQLISQVAAQAGVKRIIYVSHLGADRASAFPLLKAKAIAEKHIQNSGLDYTIFRSAPLFGPYDQFTQSLSRLLKISPGVFLMPGDGTTVLQPLWIEDLITCMTWALEDQDTINQVFSVGGPEYLTIHSIVEMIMDKMNIRRQILPVVPAYLRVLAILLDQFFPKFPMSIYMLDYLAIDRTSALDTLPRVFGIMPERLSQHLDHLEVAKRWKII